MANVPNRPALLGLATMLGCVGLCAEPLRAQTAPATLTAPGYQNASGQNPPAQNPTGQNPANPAAPNPAPPPRNNPFKLSNVWIVPYIGTYLPTNSRTRSQFGNSWFGLGVGFGPLAQLKPSGRFEPAVGLMSDAHDENNMFAGLLGVGYRWPLVGRLRREVVSADGTPVPPGAPAGSGQHTRYIYPAFAPYAGIATDLVIADVHDLADGIHSGVRYGASGDLFLGATYQRRFFFEARYRLMTEIKSFDFSGLRLSLGYSFRL